MSRHPLLRVLYAWPIGVSMPHLDERRSRVTEGIDAQPGAAYIQEGVACTAISTLGEALQLSGNVDRISAGPQRSPLLPPVGE